MLFSFADYLNHFLMPPNTRQKIHASFSSSYTVVPLTELTNPKPMPVVAFK